MINCVRHVIWGKLDLMFISPEDLMSSGALQRVLKSHLFASSCSFANFKGLHVKFDVQTFYFVY